MNKKNKMHEYIYNKHYIKRTVSFDFMVTSPNFIYFFSSDRQITTVFFFLLVAIQSQPIFSPHLHIQVLSK